MKLSLLHQNNCFLIEKKRIYLYHGAPKSTLSSIIANGLDTSKKRYFGYTEDPKVFFSYKPEEAQPADTTDGYILVEVETDERSQYLGAGQAPSWMKAIQNRDFEYLHPKAKEKLNLILNKLTELAKTTMDPMSGLTDSEKEFLFRIEALHSRKTGEFQAKIAGTLGTPEAFIGHKIGYKGRTRIIAIYEIDKDGLIKKIIYKNGIPNLIIGQKLETNKS